MPRRKFLFTAKNAAGELKGEGMSLRDKIKQESVAALKAGDKRKVEVLRFLVSLLDKKEMQLPPGKMKEADEVAVMRKELKNKQESRQIFVKAERSELVRQVDYEIGVVEAYLPRQMSEGEVAKIVEEVVASLDSLKSSNGVNFGQIMGQVMAKTEGRADGSLVAKVVKQKIGEK